MSAENDHRFRCPVCHFRVFNRRVASCESCGASLPAELLLSEEDVAKLDAEYRSHQAAREARFQHSMRPSIEQTAALKATEYIFEALSEAEIEPRFPGSGDDGESR